jgi:hypothetical protein
MKALGNIYGNGSRHVTQRIKLTDTLNWESLFIPSRLSSCQSTNSPVGVNPHGSTEKVKLLLNSSHLERRKLYATVSKEKNGRGWGGSFFIGDEGRGGARGGGELLARAVLPATPDAMLARWEQGSRVANQWPHHRTVSILYFSNIFQIALY